MELEIPVFEKDGLTYLLIDGKKLQFGFNDAKDEHGEYKVDEVVAQLLKVAGFNFDNLRRSCYENRPHFFGKRRSHGREISLDAVALIYVGDRVIHGEHEHLVDSMIEGKHLAAVSEKLSVDCLSEIRRSVYALEDITGIGLKTVLRASQDYERESEKGFFPLPKYASPEPDNRIAYPVGSSGVDTVLTALLTERALEDIKPRQSPFEYRDMGVRGGIGNSIDINFYMSNPTPTRLTKAVNAFALFFDFVVDHREQVGELVRLCQKAYTIKAVDDDLTADEVTDSMNPRNPVNTHMGHAYTEAMRQANLVLAELRKQHSSPLMHYAVHTNPRENYHFD